MCSLTAIVLMTTSLSRGSFVTEGAWAVDASAVPMLNCSYVWTGNDTSNVSLLEPILRRHLTRVTDYRREYETFGSCTCSDPYRYFLNVVAASSRVTDKKACLDSDWHKTACPDSSWVYEWPESRRLTMPRKRHEANAF